MGAEDHAGTEPAAIEYTMDLRLAAVFIIWAAGLLGAGAPLLARNRLQQSAAASVVRAFSGAVILALALVHILPEASEELHAVTEFPVGG
jgi:zinc transporter 1/2/3